jgi:hypothetical protein
VIAAQELYNPSLPELPQSISQVWVPLEATTDPHNRSHCIELHKTSFRVSSNDYNSFFFMVHSLNAQGKVPLPTLTRGTFIINVSEFAEKDVLFALLLTPRHGRMKSWHYGKMFLTQILLQ